MADFYKLNFDMDMIDEAISLRKPYIYAEACNLDELEVEGIKKGFFDRIVLKKMSIAELPNMIFYYSSLASKRESDYLTNVKGWPIIHKKVMNKFIQDDIRGIKFYPIQLVDVCTNEINNDYNLLYIENFIDAFDMEKSQYKYNEKYNMYTFIPKKTYLNRGNCDGYDIFRADKSVSGIYVSERVKKIIENNGYTGFKFTVQN